MVNGFRGGKAPAYVLENSHKSHQTKKTFRNPEGLFLSEKY